MPGPLPPEPNISDHQPERALANITQCARERSVCIWDYERDACAKDASVIGLVFIAFAGACTINRPLITMHD